MKFSKVSLWALFFSRNYKPGCVRQAEAWMHLYPSHAERASWKQPAPRGTQGVPAGKHASYTLTHINAEKVFLYLCIIYSFYETNVRRSKHWPL